jgi:hypothetical protein
MDIASLWLDDPNTSHNFEKIKKLQRGEIDLEDENGNIDESGIISENLIFTKFLLSHREYNEFTKNLNENTP